MNDVLTDIATSIANIEGYIAGKNPLAINECRSALEQARSEINKLRAKNVELGWIVNPDRSGG